MANSVFIFPNIGIVLPTGLTTYDLITIYKNSLGVTTTAGMKLINSTAAAAGAQQYSPGISQIGQGWKTDATAGSQPIEVRRELRPAQGAAAPTYSYVLMGRVNNGAWVDLLTTTSTGGLTVPSTLSLSGGLSGTSYIRAGATLQIFWNGRSAMWSGGDGQWRVSNSADTTGIRFQFAAAPTIASGFGTNPSITTGSTDTAGQVNVGTGGSATAGVINFATTWSSAPFVVAMNASTGLVLKAIASTTQLTITSSAAFTASDLVSWICIGA